jgi:hypothetical protein
LLHQHDRARLSCLRKTELTQLVLRQFVPYQPAVGEQALQPLVFVQLGRLQQAQLVAEGKQLIGKLRRIFKAAKRSESGSEDCFKGKLRRLFETSVLAGSDRLRKRQPLR